MFEKSTGEKIRDLLEDIDIVRTSPHIVLLQRNTYAIGLRENVRAALIASTLNLNSLDYVKRHYCKPSDKKGIILPNQSYISAYKVAKSYIERLLHKVNSDNQSEPTMGEFGACIVLERLIPSFFCAHLLYQLGYEYEGYTLSRLILEQIAWAYVAYPLDDTNAIAKIETTKSITKLKNFVPMVGKVYGFLSKKTHIDYSLHSEFLSIKDGRNKLHYTHDNYWDYASITLFLADIFGIVLEISQYTYIHKPETIASTQSGMKPNPKRPFIKIMQKSLLAIDKKRGTMSY